MSAAFARDGAALSAEFTQLKKERDEALKLAASRLDLLTEIDEASGKIESEMEELQEQLDLEKSRVQIRTEPSRLEIAAMIFAGGTEQTITDAFLAAEELIEHARKTE
jgi:lipid II:glycine glycyltransferase (peptidoglycan interpeptide bridge formation enzyme)